MNNNQQLNKFTYPCLIGQQGGRRVLTISVTFTELFRVLAVNRQQHTLERSQRVLNQKRATAFADYLVNALSTKSDYIIPPLIVRARNRNPSDSQSAHISAHINCK
ncbi:putative bacteriophage protein [Salmonella enterica subsp. salamae]|uniref:Putative bacteriophage protein n=1 Tax=Salmonella enterica TaxID=28901 RepID=A0A379SDI5_SALER|nr:putative bacteriophage protein [Salmonella enterica]SUJ12711.1 putative bacteriophage protein [Salmonella enterica subsp. salamae]